MKKLLSLFLSLPCFASWDYNTSNQDWTVDITNSCVYQSPKFVSLGTSSCDSTFKFLITPSNTQGSLYLNHYTTPTLNTSGDLHIRHKSGTENTTGISMQVDQNGFASTTASNVLYYTTDMVPGDLSAVNLILIDSSNSTGGQMSAMNVNKIGTGTNQVAAVFVGPGVRPIEHITGAAPSAAQQNWIETTGPTYTDSNAAFTSPFTDVQMFVNQNDYIYIGNAFTFFSILVDLDIISSNNITATFEYSTASGWTTFTPNDGTLGFTRDGNIDWDSNVLVAAGWVAKSVNGISKYYIRIRRTRSALTTPPTENIIFTASGTENYWDESGSIQVQQIRVQGTSTNSFSGPIQLSGVVTSLPACDASYVGMQRMFDNGANKISLCVCEKTGASSYVWSAATPGGAC